jgi:hypothetical protein
MTEVLPELRDLPAGLVLDGELVAWKKSQPYFPLICRRVLNREMSVPMTYVIFDVLRHDGDDLTGDPYVSRRRSSRSCGSRSRVGRLLRPSRTAPRSSTPSAGSDWKAWSRSDWGAATAPVCTAGSRRRTPATGAATPSARRCSARGNVVSEPASRAIRQNDRGAAKPPSSADAEACGLGERPRRPRSECRTAWSLSHSGAVPAQPRCRTLVPYRPAPDHA